ncbi:MAG: hypothetical protein K2X38_23500 [Gemmataceae bacterium]|nr:hypothetical protein [Gemmataceae bacterium]
MPPLPRGPELGKWGEAPAAGSGRIAVAAHRGAMILTFGILALIPCILTSLLFGALAWTMGEADLREMRAGAMNSEGEGLTAAGRTMGIVGLVLWSMVHFFWCGAAIR